MQHNGLWRMAVWALRVGYLGLAVAIVGLIALAFGSTPMGPRRRGDRLARHRPGDVDRLPLGAARATRARPRLWSMRLMLIRDSVHPL